MIAINGKIKQLYLILVITTLIGILYSFPIEPAKITYNTDLKEAAKESKRETHYFKGLNPARNFRY